MIPLGFFLGGPGVLKLHEREWDGYRESCLEFGMIEVVLMAFKAYERMLMDREWHIDANYTQRI